MWADLKVKCPQDGEWFAVTRVDDAGGVYPVCYLSREAFDELSPEMERLAGPANFDVVRATAIPDESKRGSE